jgi:hypothetical protein
LFKYEFDRLNTNLIIFDHLRLKNLKELNFVLIYL